MQLCKFDDNRNKQQSKSILQLFAIMKSTLAKFEARKQKSSYPTKKNSQAYSLIYKEMHSQLEHICDKNPKQQKSKPVKFEKPQKYSLHSIKKKSSIVNIPLHPPRDQSNLHPISRQLIHISYKNSQTFLNQTKTRQNSIATTSSYTVLDKKSFHYQYIIGKGGFGKVWRAKHIKNRNQYALKQMLKSLVMTKKSVQSIINQRSLLADLCSPFLVNMHFAFQDRDTLYLVLDLMEGGDLRYHIGNKSFSQIQAKFFIACIVLGLQYLHSNKIIHRDIKPENLVLDSRGYIRITDLGIARLYKPNNSSDTSGTPGYMSPQVICRQNHGYVSDYFAVGAIAYEFMTGKRPYQGRSRNQIRDQMLAKQVQIKSHEIPKDWSQDAADFINRLIQRKPQNRLGFSGTHEIKNHPWIKDINWKKLLNKQIQSPFVPMMKKQHFDQDEQITIQDESEAELIEKNTLLLRKQQFQDLFRNYYYDGRRIKQSTFDMKNPKTMSNNFFGQYDQKQSLKSSKQSIEKTDPTSRNPSSGPQNNWDMLQTIALNRQRRKPAQQRGFFKF